MNAGNSKNSTKIKSHRQNRDSNAGTPHRHVKRWGGWAQLAGMPVAFGHGRLALRFRYDEVSNSEGSV